jgi:hypothetical protein
MRSKHRTDADAEINRLHAELAAAKQAEEKFGFECQVLRDDLERIQREHNIELRLDRLGAAVKEAERLRALLEGITAAYDAYRSIGVAPAPNQYAALVDAIQAAKAAGRLEGI